MSSQIQKTAAAQFEQFSRFAADALMHGNTKAIARSGELLRGADGPRKINVTTDDKVYALRRSQVNKEANDTTRALFKKTVIDIFGGEARVPDSVWKAMNMKDFDAGKPLTARRIYKVKEAVNLETAKLRQANMWLKSVLLPTGKTLSDDQYMQAKGIIAKYANSLKNVDQNVRKYIIERLIDIVADPKLGSHAADLFALIPWDLESLRTFTLDDVREMAPQSLLG